MSNGYTEVFAWGSDHAGQLGLGDNLIEKKFCIPRFCSFNVLISAISCGEEHCGFITSTGLMYTIGSNADGRLGIGNKSLKHTSSPCLVELPTRTPAVQISCGAWHTAASLEDGSLYSWGLGDYGVNGIKSTETCWIPVEVALKPTVKVAQVSCGDNHTAIVSYIGELWMCGDGESGQLGTYRWENESVFQPVSLPEDVASVACGTTHTAIVTTSGMVYTMGGNSGGQLGIGSRQNTNTPMAVSQLSDVFVSQIAAGFHTAALSSHGEIYIWGSGVFGNFLTPEKLVLNSVFKSLDIGGSSAAALDVNGTVWTWGSNSQGELGLGDFEVHPNPQPIVSLQGKQVKHLSCGGKFAIAIGNDVTKEDRAEVTPKKLGIQAQIKEISDTLQKQKRGIASPFSRSPNNAKYDTAPLRATMSPMEKRNTSKKNSPHQNMNLEQKSTKFFSAKDNSITQGKSPPHFQQMELSPHPAQVNRLTTSQIQGNQYGSHLSEVEALRQQLKDIEHFHRQEINTTKEQMQHQITIAQERMQKEVIRCSEADSRLETLTMQYNRYEQKVGQSKSLLEEIQNALSKRNAELNDVYSEVDRVNTENLQLRNEITRLESQNNEVEGLRTRAEEMARDIEGNAKLRSEDSNRILDLLNKERQDLTVKLDNELAKNTTLERQANEYRDEIIKANKLIDDQHGDYNKLRRQAQDFEEQLVNVTSKMNYVTNERDQQRLYLDEAEVKLESLEKENNILKDTNNGLESKNEELFRQLERELSSKAREFKERALGTLSGNAPLNNTMHTPDLPDFGSSKIYRPTISKNQSPFESAQMSAAKIQHNRSAFMESMGRGQSPVDERYNSPQRDYSPMQPSRLVAQVEEDYAPSKSREGLSRTTQKKLHATASALATESKGPSRRMAASTSPMRGGRGSPQGRSNVQDLKSNLAGIKAQLEKLQSNKYQIEGKMAQFEEKLKRASDF